MKNLKTISVKKKILDFRVIALKCDSSTRGTTIKKNSSNYYIQNSNVLIALFLMLRAAVLTERVTALCFRFLRCTQHL